MGASVMCASFQAHADFMACVLLLPCQICVLLCVCVCVCVRVWVQMCVCLCVCDTHYRVAQRTRLPRCGPMARCSKRVMPTHSVYSCGNCTRAGELTHTHTHTHMETYTQTYRQAHMARLVHAARPSCMPCQPGDKGALLSTKIRALHVCVCVFVCVCVCVRVRVGFYPRSCE